MKKMKRMLEPLEIESLRSIIDGVSAWFLGTYMMELIDNYEAFQSKEMKNQFIDYFYNEYYQSVGSKRELKERMNLAIRIIESNLVREAMEMILEREEKTNETEEAKKGARYMLDSLEDGSSVLPVFQG